MRTAIRMWGVTWRVAVGLWSASALGAGTPTRTVRRPLRLPDLIVSGSPQIATIVDYMAANGLRPIPDETSLAPLLDESASSTPRAVRGKRELMPALLKKPVDFKPIIGGTRSPTTHFVALLLKDGLPHCTATIVGPHTLLTAAHCVATTSAAQRFPPGSLSLTTDAGGFPVEETLPHPLYKMQSEPFALTNDVALFYTAADLSSYAILGVASIQRSPLAPSDCRSKATFVGYGVTSVDPRKGPQGAGERNATELFFSCDADALTYGSADHGTCYGDSGGPALLPSQSPERVIGVTSFALRDLCDGQAKDVRVDAYTPWLTANIR